MSENKHTPEPWAIDPDDRPNMHWNNHIVSEANPNIAICFMAHDGTEQNERGEANARRIVACVNALEGLNDYALSGGWSFRGIEAYAKGLEKQCDELLAALERLSFAALCRDSTMGDQCRLIEVRAELAAANKQAMEAIASVKEKK